MKCESINEKLGTISLQDYELHKHNLHGAAAKRAAHFFSERRRVHEGVIAWRNGNLSEFGRLMSASGLSSIENYECGSPALIDLYNIIVSTTGIYGGRFSGAGFRGCCVAFANPESVEDACHSIQRYAPQRTSILTITLLLMIVRHRTVHM
jgi:galacturonokinase